MSKSFCRLMTISLIVVGLILLLDGLILSTIINFNIGLVAVALLGLVTLCAGIFFERLINGCNRGGRMVLWMAVSGFVGFFIASMGIAMYGEIDTVNYTEEALIVLGAGIHGEAVTMPLKYRLDSAIAYHQKNPQALIIVSGGQGAGENITEALAMERYLKKKRRSN